MHPCGSVMTLLAFIQLIIPVLFMLPHLAFISHCVCTTKLQQKHKASQNRKLKQGLWIACFCLFPCPTQGLSEAPYYHISQSRNWFAFSQLIGRWKYQPNILILSDLIETTSLGCDKLVKNDILGRNCSNGACQCQWELLLNYFRILFSEEQNSPVQPQGWT